MRDLTTDMIDEFAGGSVNPTFMAEAFFDSGPLRVWTGLGTLDWDGNTYFGAGSLIGISNISESQEIQANGIVVSLSGIPSSIISLALAERSRGRPFRLYLASATGNDLIDSPYRIFSGMMDNIEITANGETCSVRLSVESILIIGQRSKIRRYTNEDQRKFYPTDEGFKFINALQDKEVVW